MSKKSPTFATGAAALDAVVVVSGGIMDFLRDAAGAGATTAPGCMDFLLVDIVSKL